MNIDEKLARARRARVDGDWRGAELLCREILDKNPVHPEGTGLLGQLLAEHDDLAAASHFIDIAIGLAPMSADVRLNAAALKDRQGDLKGALDEAKRASELGPQKFEVWATYGNLLGKALLFEQAAKALRIACTLNPRHPGAALLLGIDWRTSVAVGLGLSLSSTAFALQAMAPGASVGALHATRRAASWPFLAAIPLGVAMGVSPVVSTFLTPLFRFFSVLAGIAWIPIATLWFGYGFGAITFVIFNAVFFIVTYNTLLGVSTIPRQTRNAAASLGAGHWAMLTEVLLPGALPNIVTGIRTGFGFAWRRCLPLPWLKAEIQRPLNAIFLEGTDSQRLQRELGGNIRSLGYREHIAA